MRQYRVLVCGSRVWHDYECLRQRLSELPEGTAIIHGGARGADLQASIAARALGLETQVFPARWHELGKKAGIVRNIEMLETAPDLVLAFWDGQSTGTAHTIHEARKRGIAIEIVKQG